MEHIIKASMIVGPILGYLDQANNMRKLRSSSGFSVAICGVLLVAKLGKRFDEVLLYQSFLMIAVQLHLLYLTVRFRDGFKKTSFWNWENIQQYFQFLLALAGGLLVLQMIFGQNSYYVELLGMLAVGIEAMLPVPQIYSNYQRKSVKGFSLLVLGSWVGGDAFKTYYYISNASPTQFLACGIFQLFMDCMLVLQTLTYKDEEHIA